MNKYLLNGKRIRELEIILESYNTKFITDSDHIVKCIAIVPTSAYCPSAEQILVTVISFFVRVPVLSEHITVAQPKNNNIVKIMRQ
jgi:hypothetical protein